MSLASWLIWLNAVVFITYGVAFTLAPATLSLLVTDGLPQSGSATIDMRSTYGGMSIGLGVVLVLLARDPSLHGLGLRAVAIVMSCMAGSRVLGIAIDSGANTFMWGYLAAEVVVACLCLWALRGIRLAAEEDVASDAR